MDLFGGMWFVWLGLGVFGIGGVSWFGFVYVVT